MPQSRTRVGTVRAWRVAWPDTNPCLLTQYATVEGAFPTSRAIDSSRGGVPEEQLVAMLDEGPVHSGDGHVARAQLLSSPSLARALRAGDTPCPSARRDRKCAGRR